VKSGVKNKATSENRVEKSVNNDSMS
jgi:hypothetical protein